MARLGIPSGCRATLKHPAAAGCFGCAGGLLGLALSAQLRADIAPSGRVLDVQGHFIDTPKGNSKSAEVFLKDVFMDSDTDLMVLVQASAPRALADWYGACDVLLLTSRREGRPNVVLEAMAAPNRSSIVLAASTDLLGFPLAGLIDDDSRTSEQAFIVIRRLAGAYDSAPSWSPDGRQIAFVRESVGDHSTELIVANADGSAERRLTRRAVARVLDGHARRGARRERDMRAGPGL